MKQTMKKTLSLLMALALLLGLMPQFSLTVSAASNLVNGFEGQEADIFSALGFDTSEIPEGYDAETTENPYGRDTVLGNQVFELLTASSGGTTVYGDDDNSVDASTIGGYPSRGADIPLELYAVAAGDFDGDGLPGETVYVGYKYGETRYDNYTEASPVYMAVYDVKTGTISGLKTLGATNPAWVIKQGGKDYSAYDYAWQNLLQVTAGDYDCDGIMEIAVYVADNGNSRVDVYKYQKTSLSSETDWLKIGNWERVWTHVLSNTKNEIPNMVSLVSGDFNRDGVDDLGISTGRFAPFGEGGVTMDQSKAEILWGAKNDMLQRFSPLDLNEAELGDLTRVSLIKGDLDEDGYPELIATGHPMEDLYNYQTSYADVKVYETNTKRTITTYIYDATLGLVKNYSGIQKVVDGSMNTTDVNGTPTQIWQSGNGFDQQSYSQPLMRTNAAVIRPQGMDYSYLYLDGYLYESAEGQLNLKISLDEANNVYNGDQSLRVRSNVGNGHWGTNNYTANSGLYSSHYAEFGAVSGDIHGEGYGILASSFFRANSRHDGHFASYGVLSGNADGRLGISMTMDAITADKTYVDGVNSVVSAMVDVDLDTVIIEYTGEHYLTYSDPKVLAVIAAAPYFEDVDEVSGYDYAWQNTTSFSDFSGHGEGELVGVDLEAGLFIESSVTVGGGALGFENAIMVTLEWEKSHSETKEYTMTFETSQNEDAVAFYSIPTENYVYNIYTPDGAGGYNKTVDIISNTFNPCFQVLNLDYYESIRGSYDELPAVRGMALTSTPGDPSSYPSSTSGYDVIAEWNKEPAAVSFGNGSITQEITITKEEASSKALGAAYDWKVGGGAHVQSDLLQSDASVIGGAQWSLNPTKGETTVDLTGTTISGTVTNMPLQFRDYGYYYSWKLFSYSLDLKDGSSVPVVSYVVDDVSQPPELPEDFQQDYDRTTSEKNVLTWTYDHNFSKFYIYRYFDFPVGGGFQLVKEVPSDTAEYTLKYDENGKPYKEYYFEDENLAAYTEYEYAIQVERLAKVPPLSSPSANLVARTKASQGYPVMNLIESDGENDRKLLVYPDKTSTITVDVTGPDGEAPGGYYTTVQYQWQKQEEGAWVDLVNETEATLTLAETDASAKGEYRCRVNVLTKSNNTAITAYTNSISLTHARRSAYVEEVYVNDVSGGGVELFVKVVNAHSDSASIPGGDIVFNLTNNATGRTYQYSTRLNTAGVINVILEESLPEGMYNVNVYYGGSKIFKSCQDNTLYLSQRGSGYDIDVARAITYGDGTEVIFRSVSKAAGVTSATEEAAYAYKLLMAEPLSAVSIKGAVKVAAGGSVTAGKAYYVESDDIKYYFTASHSGTLQLEDLYAVIGDTSNYLSYTNDGGIYALAPNTPAGNYAVRMTGNDGSTVYMPFTVEPRPVTLQLPTQKGAEGNANGQADEEPTDAPRVFLRALPVVSGGWAECDMPDGTLTGSIGSQSLYLDYVNTAGTVFSRWNVDALCGYYTIRGQEANNARFPNYDLKLLDGSITIQGATKEVAIGVRPFEGQQVGTLYAISPEYDATRADLPDEDVLIQEHATGTRLVFSAVPDEGYEIYDWYINGVAQGRKDSSLAYVLLAEDTTVEVQFAIRQNTLIFGTAGDEGGGTIVCDEPDLTSGSAVLANSHFFFTAKANEGYHFKEWRYTELGSGTAYDDTDFGLDESSFELLMPGISCSVYAVFERDFYQLSYTDRSGADGITAWYEGSRTGDATAKPERVYIQNGDMVKGDTLITVGPKPGYVRGENQAYVSQGSQGTMNPETGVYVLTLKEDTHVSGYSYQDQYDLTLAFHVDTHDVFPEGTQLSYSIGNEEAVFVYTEDAPTLTISDIPGGTEVSAQISYPGYYDFDGLTNAATMLTATATQNKLAEKITAGSPVTENTPYYYEDSSTGQKQVWYFTAPVDGTAQWNQNAVTVYASDAEFTIGALAADETISVHLTEKESYTVTMADVSGKGSYGIELPAGAYQTVGGDGRTQVTVHEGDNFTVLVTPAQKWTVSYWRTTPQNGPVSYVRATSLKYMIPAITQNFTFEPIFSSTTYNTISWPSISADRNGLTLSPTSGYLSNVSAGSAFKFKLSGPTLPLISQVFANGEPFVAEGENAGKLTYTGSGADRVYTVSDIQENTVITVQMIDIGVTVNGVDIVNITGPGWRYDPISQVLSITRSNLEISGKTTTHAPNLTLNLGPEAVSAVFTNLHMDPASGSSANRIAVSAYADKTTITVNGSSFIEGCINAKDLVVRGNGELKVENVQGVSIEARNLTMLGTAVLRLTNPSSNDSAIISDTLTMGAEGSKTATPILRADGCIQAGTIDQYGGDIAVDAPVYALMIKSMNNYGGTLSLQTGTEINKQYVIYVNEGGTGWRVHRNGYVVRYSKGADADAATDFVTPDQFSNAGYNQLAAYKQTALNDNTFLRLDMMGSSSNDMTLEINYEGTVYSTVITQRAADSALLYHYIDLNDGTMKTTEVSEDDTLSSALMRNWRIVATQDYGGLQLQAYDIEIETDGSRLAHYRFVRSETATYDYTLTGKAVTRNEGSNEYGLGVNGNTGSIARFALRDYTAKDSVIWVNHNQPLYLYGDNYLYNGGGQSIEVQRVEGADPILQLASDGTGTLTMETVSGLNINVQTLILANVKSLTAIAPEGKQSLNCFGGLFEIPLYVYDFSNTLTVESTGDVIPTMISYGNGYLQDLGDNAASATTLEDYTVSSYCKGYTRIYGITTDASIGTEHIVYDRDGSEDTVFTPIAPPVSAGTMHHVVSAALLDSEGNETALAIKSLFDLENTSACDIIYNGQWLTQTMLVEMENGPALGQIPDGSYTLRIQFRDPDPYDATFYFLDVPLTITHGTLSDSKLSMDPVEAIAGREQSVTLITAFEGLTPSRYVWYVDGAEVPGATGSTYTLTVPADAQIGSTIEVKAESYDGENLLGYAGAAVTVTPSAEDITFTSPDQTPDEDGSYLIRPLPYGAEMDLDATVSMNNGETSEEVDWILWGNTLDSTYVDENGLVTVDRGETGTNGTLRITATYTNVDGTKRSKTVTVNLSSDAWVFWYPEDNEGGALSGATANGEAIDPEGGYVAAGSEIIVTAHPEEGNVVSEWFVGDFVVRNGETFQIDRKNNTLRFTAEAMGNYSVIATFAAQADVELSYSAGEHGTVTAEANGETLDSGALLPMGSSVTFTAAPEEYYVVKAWYVDGVLQEGSTGLTLILTDLSTDHTVSVEFAPAERTVTLLAQGSGSIKAADLTGNDGVYKVPAMDPIVLTAEPEEGFELTGWAIGSIDDVLEAESSTYTLEPGMDDITIWAIFRTLDHVHDYAKETVEPTCKSMGYTVYTCACGHSYKEDYVDALGHSFETVVTEPTCTTIGYTTYTCFCGSSFEGNFVDALGHSYEAVATAPTCITIGYTTFTCFCGSSYKTNYVDALGHSFEAVVTEPTCITMGYTTYSCACGHSYKADYADTTGHDYVPEIIAPTCTADGYTLYTCQTEGCGHNYVADPVKATGHSYTVEVIAPDCGALGYTIYTCECGDSYKTDFVATVSHSCKEIVVEPICNSMGYTIYTCSCGHSYKGDYVDAIGHDYSSEAVEPTCTTGGYTIYTCSCGNEYIADPVPATGHSYTDKVTAPTHDAMGYTTHTCSCGHSYVDSYTDALEHEYTKRVTLEATCTKDGEMTFSCECGKSYTQPIPRIEHTFTAKVTAPTCEAMGYTTYTCTCGESYTGSYVDAIDHNLTEVTLAPDCLISGYTQVQCSDCGYSAVTAIAQPTGEHSTITVGAVESTYTQEGYTGDLVCEHCGTVIEVGRFIPMVMLPSAEFVDVGEDEWFTDAVDYVVEAGLMQGVGDNTFAPNQETTRGMMVTMLYRMAGSPDVAGIANPFTDVAEGSWYYKAVLWASQAGVVKGVSETLFAPDQVITREQMVTMLHRYAGEPEADVTLLESFPDDKDVSGFAKAAMSWAIENGIITGIEDGGKTLLKPLNTATRSQIAVIFMRYMEL